MEVVVLEYRVTLVWDGLAFLKIAIDKGTKVIGLCGNNDGMLL